MNIQMNELHGIDICDITSHYNDKFHKEWTWVYSDIVDEIHALSPWHSISFWLVRVCSLHHMHAIEQDIGVDD